MSADNFINMGSGIGGAVGTAFGSYLGPVGSVVGGMIGKQAGGQTSADFLQSVNDLESGNIEEGILDMGEVVFDPGWNTLGGIVDGVPIIEDTVSAAETIFNPVETVKFITDLF